MISIQDHRSAVGLYCAKAQLLSAKGKSRLPRLVESSVNRKLKKVSSYFDLKIALIMFLCLRLLVHSVVAGVLLKSGDIETNPGPTYALEKVVHGSFHQGNRQLFGETAGIQCACNALYALCWTQIKQIFHWTKRDLDHILVEGDNLYKSLHTFDMLTVDQLPAFVRMYNHNIPVQYLRLETQMITLINGDLFLRDVLTTGNGGMILCLLILEGFTTSIILSRNSYYLFDSHSRDERGLSVVDGTSVLLKFQDLYEIEKYFQVAYLELRDRQQAFFQLQFVEVNVGNHEKADIYSQYTRTVRLSRDREHAEDINRKKKMYYTSLKGSPQHSKINMKKRERSKKAYAQTNDQSNSTTTVVEGIKRRRLFVSIFEKKVSDFKQLIKNGPYFICVICNRCLYRTSVICFKNDRYKVDENIIFNVKSYDAKYYICNTCDKALRKDKVPCQAVVNKLDVVELPKLFQDIRRLERLLVSRRILFKKVTVMPKGKSLKMKGSICNIPVSEVDVNCNMLPRPADSNGLIIVKLKRKLEYKGHVIFEAVRADVVLQFLEFLRCHKH